MPALEIDEGLQVLLGHAFLCQLGNQHMQAFRAERGLIAGHRDRRHKPAGAPATSRRGDRLMVTAFACPPP